MDARLLSQVDPSMALAYYRYCQRAGFKGFQPISWNVFSKLYQCGLDFTYQPRGE